MARRRPISAPAPGLRARRVLRAAIVPLAGDALPAAAGAAAAEGTLRVVESGPFHGRPRRVAPGLIPVTG